MIPCLDDEYRDRWAAAIDKALELKPTVTKVGEPINGEQIWRVDKTHEIGRYYVIRFTDADGQHFVECWCAAGTPAIDAETRLPAYQPCPCWHSASVLLRESRLEEVEQ